MRLDRRARGQWGQERMLHGSDFGKTLLLTCCLYLSPSFHVALLSISFQYVHAHHKAALVPPHLSPHACRSAECKHIFLIIKHGHGTSPHTLCKTSQPGSLNVNLGSYKKVDVFFRNTSSPTEQNFKGGTFCSLSFPLQRVLERCLMGTSLPREMQLSCCRKGCVLHAIKPECESRVRS